METSAGGKTKFNRTRLNIPKTHALDAACTGETPALAGWDIGVLAMKAFGRGAYQRTRVNSSGAPTGLLTRKKKAFGFQTGDIVLAIVPRGKQRRVPLPENLWLTDTALPTLLVHTLSAEARRQLARCNNLLPKDACIFQVGLMLARSSDKTRSCGRPLAKANNGLIANARLGGISRCGGRPCRSGFRCYRSPTSNRWSGMLC